MLKRIACAALALTLLGTTAAEARGWGGGYHGGYRHHGNGGAALGIGLGLLALGIIAETAHDHDRDRDEYYRDRDRDGAYNHGNDGYRDGDRYRDNRDDRDSGGYDRDDR
ncbi:MAG TPA: hypothetical protein VHZ78_09550 [Rhizomicrobium sp.]|jgi:hypothetical protein|nr:hypothetical protein [Rhizomicrobium sp.]